MNRKGCQERVGYPFQSTTGSSWCWAIGNAQPQRIPILPSRFFPERERLPDTLSSNSVRGRNKLMYTPQTYFAALVLVVISMLCWGSWANLPKALPKWRFEYFYLDFTL